MIPFRKDWSGMKRLLMVTPALAAPTEDIQATGNPVVFQTDLAKPLKALRVNLLPRQQGSGDPSPTNVRDIVPWTGVNLWAAGKNIIDKSQLEDGKVWWNGKETSGYANNCITGFIPVKGGATYFRQGQTGNQNGVSFFDSDKKFISQAVWQPGNAYTIPANAFFAGFSFGKDYKDEAMVFVGSTATAYEPYVPITETALTLPTLYGGWVDTVSGEVWATYEGVTYTGRGTEGWGVTEISSNVNRMSIRTNAKASSTLKTSYCKSSNQPNYWNAFIGSTGNLLVFVPAENFPTASSFKSYLSENPLEVVYELETPVLLGTITPAQISALRGSNTLWSDGNGLLDLTYTRKKVNG